MITYHIVRYDDQAKTTHAVEDDGYPQRTLCFSRITRRWIPAEGDKPTCRDCLRVVEDLKMERKGQ